MSEDKKTKGGERKGAGRKEYENKEDLKAPVTVYIKQSVITEKGGIKEVKEKTIKFINNLPTIKKQP